MDVTEAIRRLSELEGEPLSRLRGSLPDKAYARRLLERRVGALPRFVRTVPTHRDLRPQEPTKVGQIPFDRIVRVPFDRSDLRSVLNDLVLVAIVKPDKKDPTTWTIGPVARFPSDRYLPQVREDYETIRSMIRAGRGDELSSAEPPRGHGVVVTAKTSGRDSSDRVPYVGDDGQLRFARRRAFFIRPRFVEIALRTAQRHPDLT